MTGSISRNGGAASGEDRRAPGPARGEGHGAGIASLELPRGCRTPDAALEPILRALDRLPADGILEARLPFDPEPLSERLAERGYRAVATARVRGGWALEVQPSGAPEILDFRNLEAPEPLERILEASAALVPGASLLARTPRFPRMLFPQLERRSLAWEVHEEPDGSALVRVRRPA